MGGLILSERTATLAPKRKHYIERTVRFHAEFLARLDALTPWLEAQADYAPTGKLGAGEKLRLALREGIRALEQAAKEGSADV
jgi:hypothetical protein